jgi:bifunctional DNA-binding transcriptional regulator/antitoxin component of YhaV-PrlF toxin-antitoxin module
MSLANSYSCRTVGGRGRVTLPTRELRERDIQPGDVLPATIVDGVLQVRFDARETASAVEADLALPVTTVGDSFAFVIPSGLRWEYDLTGGESMCTRPLEGEAGIAYPLRDADSTGSDGSIT